MSFSFLPSVNPEDFISGSNSGLRVVGGFHKSLEQQKTVQSGGRMPWSCCGDPTLKGRTLIAALKAERKIQYSGFCLCIFHWFWTGVAFVCWLLLC